MLGKRQKKINELMDKNMRLEKAFELAKEEKIKLAQSLRSARSTLTLHHQQKMDFRRAVGRETAHIWDETTQYIKDNSDAIRREEEFRSRQKILTALRPYLQQLSATSDAHQQAVLLEEFLANIEATEEDRSILFKTIVSTNEE